MHHTQLQRQTGGKQGCRLLWVLSCHPPLAARAASLCPLGMERRHHRWQPTHPPAQTRTLKCHKTNRTEKEMHYLNFHRYFSPCFPCFF